MDDLYLDELLWIEGQSETDEAQGHPESGGGIQRRLETGNGRMRETPLCVMESIFIKGYDPTTGQTIVDWDDGSTEAWELSEKSTAFRVLRALLQTGTTDNGTA